MHLLNIVWEFEYATCQFVVQHWWWIVHIWDGICVIWIDGYLTRPLWWNHWECIGRPAMERVFELGADYMEDILGRWGLVVKGRRRQDTEQGGRKRLD